MCFDQIMSSAVFLFIMPRLYIVNEDRMKNQTAAVFFDTKLNLHTPVSARESASLNFRLPFPQCPCTTKS